MSFSTTFNIGPSQISLETYEDIENFSREKLGEISHRSQKFTEISQKADQELRKYFAIPDDYTIVWGSSATEMMELCVKSLVQKNSFHFTCGGFSERFTEISQNMDKNAQSQAAKWGTPNDFEIEIPSEAEIVTITHSETSTGVGVNPADFLQVKEKLNDDQILIIDATSIMGTLPVNISDADAWLFSVQKCFGLPAGLGVMIFNEKVLKKAQSKPNPIGVLNLPEMAKKMQGKYHTIQTPNTFGIYLLGERAEFWNKNGGIERISAKIGEKNEFVEKIINNHPCFDFFIKDKLHRSHSITVIEGNKKNIAKVHELAKKNGILLGEGYGSLKETTVRLAIFPNITMHNLEKLAEILTQI